MFERFKLLDFGISTPNWRLGSTIASNFKFGLIRQKCGRPLYYHISICQTDERVATEWREEPRWAHGIPYRAQPEKSESLHKSFIRPRRLASRNSTSNFNFNPPIRLTQSTVDENLCLFLTARTNFSRETWIRGKTYSYTYFSLSFLFVILSG